MIHLLPQMDEAVPVDTLITNLDTAYWSTSVHS
jgi:hypothetical protein